MTKYVSLSINKELAYNHWGPYDKPFLIYGFEVEEISKFLKYNGIVSYSLSECSVYDSTDPKHYQNERKYSWGELHEIFEWIKTNWPWAITSKEKKSMLTSKSFPSKQSVEKFPKLMRSIKLRFIILATSKEKLPNTLGTPTYCGTVVEGNKYQLLGTYSNAWDGSGFEDWFGEVTIKQEKT